MSSSDAWTIIGFTVFWIYLPVIVFGILTIYKGRRFIQKTGLLVGIYAVVVTIGLYLIYEEPPNWFWLTMIAGLLLATEAFVIVPGLCFHLLVKADDRPSPDDPPPDPRYCRECRYDLTGNLSGICPECGTPTLTDQSTN